MVYLISRWVNSFKRYIKIKVITFFLICAINTAHNIMCYKSIGLFVPKLWPKYQIINRCIDNCRQGLDPRIVGGCLNVVHRFVILIGLHPVFYLNFKIGGLSIF